MQRAHRFALGALVACLAGVPAFAAETKAPNPPSGQAQPAPAQGTNAQGADSQGSNAQGSNAQGSNAQAGDAKAADLSWSAPVQNKIAQCQGCHGIEGWRTAFPEVYHVPKLGGQKPEYIIAALKEYKSGDRSFATMRAIASQLTDEDMQAIAKYYGSSGNTTTAESK